MTLHKSYMNLSVAFFFEIGIIPLLLLRGEKNTAPTLNTKQNNELCEPPKGRSFANASQLCHLNLFVEKRRKNRGLRLFSAEGNKRGIIPAIATDLCSEPIRTYARCDRKPYSCVAVIHELPQMRVMFCVSPN